MFVQNFTKDVLKYDSKGNIIKLKPNTITYVSDTLVSRKALRDCFGTRIDIIEDQEVVSNFDNVFIPSDLKDTTDLTFEEEGADFFGDGADDNTKVEESKTEDEATKVEEPKVEEPKKEVKATKAPKATKTTKSTKKTTKKSTKKN